jgi:sigma-B regulation protein RsbU (phosphoserine phosphatase)
MNIFNALRSAIKAEIAAQESYENLVRETDNPEVRSLFSFLAGFEKTHQQFLEAEMRVLESEHNDKEAMPSHWLQLLSEKLNLPVNGNIGDNEEQILLSLSAAQSVANILKDANEELLKKQIRYENELAIASDIQRNLLPQRPPKDSGLKISALNIMARSVGGDYYDFLKNSRDQVAMVIGDSMGKGMPAALLMTTVRAVWQSWSASGLESPGEILGTINRIVFPDLHLNEAFITMFCALYDPKTSNFRYSNAGHNPPILFPAKAKKCVQLEVGGIPVGMFPDAEFHSDEFILKQNDLVVMFTDGVIEASNNSNVQFGFDRLCDIVNNNHDSEPDKLAQTILSEVNNHTGISTPSDDITIVILKKL